MLLTNLFGHKQRRHDLTPIEQRYVDQSRRSFIHGVA